MSDDNEIDRARELRRNMTDAEQTLWRHLRARRILDIKFRRQEPIEDYIVDFVRFNINLVVEVDGKQHQGQEGYDRKRTNSLEEQGFTIIRFWNDEVLKSTEKVLEEICRRIRENTEDTKI